MKSLNKENFCFAKKKHFFSNLFFQRKFSCEICFGVNQVSEIPICNDYMNIFFWIRYFLYPVQSNNTVITKHNTFLSNRTIFETNMVRSLTDYHLYGNRYIFVTTRLLWWSILPRTLFPVYHWRREF